VDCNRGSGGYTLKGGSLSLKHGALTRAMCAPESLHDTFLRQLGDVCTWTMTADGKLVLDLWADAGQMILRRG
jgi:heat shock protein HslJ